MKRYKNSKVEILARSWWIWFYSTRFGTVAPCGTTYTLNGGALDFYFPEKKFLDNCVITAVEITMPN